MQLEEGIPGQRGSIGEQRRPADWQLGPAADQNRSTAGQSRLSAEARERFLRLEGPPPLMSDWLDTVMIHFEVDADVLQREVPFDLDLFDGRAFVTLVAFTMSDLRTRRWPRIGRRLLQPIGTHAFLNIRTYVRVGREVGIYFLAEYLPNRLSVLLGPVAYGLPYRAGRLVYHHSDESTSMSGRVQAGKRELRYRITRKPGYTLEPSPPNSLTEYLMERYTAFTKWAGIVRRFRIWHEAWPQVEVDVEILDDSLLHATGRWATTAALHSAHYSPGVASVWMGRPRRVSVRDDRERVTERSA